MEFALQKELDRQIIIVLFAECSKMRGRKRGMRMKEMGMEQLIRIRMLWT